MTKNPMKNVSLASVLIATLLGTSAAQDKSKRQDKPTTLAQAVVAEIYEHNLGKAMGMYRVIAEDDKRTKETRTQARLRLAKAYRRLGQNTEAEAALREAASGSGPAAKEAAAILSGNAQDDGDLVKAKVEQALLAMRLTGKPDKSDLTWIGRAAVPYIVKAVDAEKADLRFIGNAARVLFQLGGSEVLKWIDATKKSEDVLRKRAIIKGFHTGDRDVRAKLAEFFQDADVTVRREVMRNGSRFLDSDAIVAAFEDKDEQVRRRAFEVVRDSWRFIDHSASEFATFLRVMPYLEKEKTKLQSWNGNQGSLAGWMSGRPVLQGVAAFSSQNAQEVESFPATDEGRRALLRAVTFPCFESCFLRWAPLSEKQGPAAYAAELAAAAKKIGPADDRSGQRQPSVRGSTRTLQRVLENVIRFWGPDAMPAVLTMVELGYDSHGKLAEWVVENGTAKDLEAVVEKLLHFQERNGVAHICNWMTHVGAPEKVLDRLVQLVEKLESSSQSRSNRFQAVLNTVLSIGSERSTAFLVQKIATGKSAYLKCIRRKINSPQERAVLQKVLALSAKNDQEAGLRKYAFEMLIKYHDDPGDPALFARAYDLGIGDSGPCVEANSPSMRSSTYRGLFWAYNGSGNWAIRCTDENRAAITAACLATGQAEAFKDLARALNWDSGHKVGAAICVNVKHCPKLVTNQGRDARSRIFRTVMSRFASGKPGAQLALDALTHEDSTIRRIGIQNLNSNIEYTPKLVEQVLARLSDADAVVRRYATRFLARTAVEVDGLVPAMTARLKDEDYQTVVSAIEFHAYRSPNTLLTHADALLAHENPNVRFNAAHKLLEKHGSKVIEKVGPLLVDAEIFANHRSKLAHQLGGLMDLKVVPFLLQALKSPDMNKVAQKMLESIRFYHEESSKWERVMKGAGFAEKSAAEALIEQAKSGKKAIRLAAIASLGTLAEAETLPFLVKLIGDADTEIAAAARDAVNRINKAGKK